jgi:hypothetical protein
MCTSKAPGYQPPPPPAIPPTPPELIIGADTKTSNRDAAKRGRAALRIDRSVGGVGDASGVNVPA